ncbi:sugar transferase [Myxacorys almedinensis]|uniref:Sugar transferase n=1 Tax=Myxacorys almedinensis A TaxID=2690445 RepID=A0A8J7Z0J0_9CYAN|nr:sugar transferase [Myxacorys almedinensis]NDJ17887.1 sugar transferase [Myxacorys almedinensis A]
MKHTLYSVQLQQGLKTVLDRGIAAIALILLSPLISTVALAVYLQMGSPIVFAQPRGGKDGRIFTFYKFRTMTNERDAEGTLLPDAQRLTKLGRLLRQTSLDELPQLWNVLKGEMSIVGPRPFIASYLDLYTPDQARRHEVKPGITGWAIINGRNTISWEEKFGLDIWYIDHWSLGLDLKILALTVVKVLKREGVDQNQSTTMSYFQGSSRLAQSATPQEPYKLSQR